jgi:hypothetical protein
MVAMHVTPFFRTVRKAGKQENQCTLSAFLPSLRFLPKVLHEKGRAAPLLYVGAILPDGSF